MSDTGQGVGTGTDEFGYTTKKTCYYCKEQGYFNANCPVRKNRSQVAIVEEKPKKTYNSGENLSLVSSARSGDLLYSWVLDSDCWFDTYHLNLVIGVQLQLVTKLLVR